MRIVDVIWQDVRYATRSLRRTPTVTAAAVVTLALGIGAVTTVFSLFQAVLLRPLDVRAPEQLYFIAHGVGDERSTSSHYPWFERVSQHTDIFEGITAYNLREFKVGSEQGVEVVGGQYASGNYHDVIGAPLQLGRGFSNENDRRPSAIAVISHGYWTRRFQRRPDVLGQPLVVGNRSVTIVGVTARGFHGMQPGRAIDITLPLSLLMQDDPEYLTRTDTWTSMPLVARLKDGVDEARARDVIGATYRAYMQLPGNVGFSRTSRGVLRAGTLTSAARGTDRLRRQYARPLEIMMGMVAAVLLISCVNVANLLLTQASARAREIAVRMSIGASRKRIGRQLLTESTLLALVGGLFGVLLAMWGTDFIAVLFRSSLNPVLLDVDPDLRVLAFAFVVSLATSLFFGIAPALRATSIDLPVTLKLGATAPGTRGRRIGQQGLVALQVALCLVLVFGASLLARTLQNLRTLDAGFNKEAVVVFPLDVRDTSFPRARLADLCQQAVERLAARPAVSSGTCSTMSPVATSSEGRGVAVPGHTRGPDTPIVWANSIDSTYFDTMGIPIRRGENILNPVAARSPQVAVISESMARYYFPNANPIGRTFQFGGRELSPPVTIVGVASDTRYDLRTAAPHMAYTPINQRSEPASDVIGAIRTSGSPAAVAGAVRDVIRALSRDVSVRYVRTMDEQINAALVTERLLAALSGAFAVLAVVLACVGLYGVMSYHVVRRARDIGIRLALGAKRSRILGQVLGRIAVVTLIGVAAGGSVAIVAARTLSSFLYGLEANDRGTLVFAVALMMATSLLAGYLPARRASRVDPAVTLRME